MGQHVLTGNPPVEITLRRSARARRISLRISGLDGRVTLTHPVQVSEAEALDFARRKGDWLRDKLGATPAAVTVDHGALIPFEGRQMRIAAGAPRTRARGDVLEVPAGRAVGARVRAWLKTQARDRLASASDRYAAALGQGHAGITLRDTRSRWGSCSARGGLMYSWRLVMAPPDVLDYVAAHEVAHLREMNHSPAYWAVVARLLPEYDAPRRWLRENGASLHRYRFGD
ncbi:M48 family metallopeptidase [Roseovarius sp. SYSU LYC5161]|uniref:M48 family metallopeptidase n=1 Tax=Roseovarius halophilus (ex Wu et al. 2025) TaxID=3376060 RepID=UPI00399BAEF4